jgi:hypothetical protein
LHKIFLFHLAIPQTRPVQRGARDILFWRPNLLYRL